jgi:hypothetical protein
VSYVHHDTLKLITYVAPQEGVTMAQILTLPDEKLIETRRETLQEGVSPYTACVEIIDGASHDWMQSRRMTYAAIYKGGFALPYIDSEDFKRLCDDRKATKKTGGDFPETRLVYMFAKDLKRDRRADVAAAMCWMHTPSLCGGCGGDDAEKLIDYFIEKGGIDKCAAAYRKWITKHGKPGDFGYQTERTKKGMATRQAKKPRQRARAAAAAAEASVAISPEAVAKIVEAEATKPVIIMPTRQPELTPEVEDEEFLEDLNLREAVDLKVANLKPVAEMRDGEKVVPDVGVYVIRKVDDVLRIYGPVIDQKVIRAALRLLPEGEMPSERLPD